MFKNNTKLKNVFLMGFLLSLHLAFTSYINSSFLSLSSSEKYVGLIYMLGSLASISALFFVPLMLRKLGGYKFLLWSSGLNALSLLLLSALKTPLQVIFIFIFYFTLNNILIFALDELLEIFSRNSSTGRVRGLYLTFVNLAWVIAQFFSGRTLAEFSFSTIYVIAFIIMSVFFLTTLLSLENLKDPKYDKAFAWQSFKKFFADKNLARSYGINFLLQFFYAWMVIYTPIYLSAHLGFGWKEIGIIFTTMLLPFVFIQFPLGQYSDKIGERTMLMIGFFITAITTLALFFIGKNEVWIWALVLFCTRVGAATVEVMSDVHFFRHIDKENDGFVSVYRNAGPTAYVLGPITAFVVFLLTPSFNFIFLILGMLMFSGVYLASTINKDII